jgi:hypothetical protein
LECHAASGHHLLEYCLFPPERLNLDFITEGKLAAIFIKPSLGVSNWPVIFTSSTTCQQVFWHHHHRAINKFSGTVAGEKEDFYKGSFARTSFTLF